MAGTLAPSPWLQFVDANGNPYVGAKLFTYAAGTTTKLATYTDQALSVANTNPIILDSAGRATVYLSNASYKFILAPSTDSDPPVSPYKTQDTIAAVPLLTVDLDVTGTAGEAIAAGEVVYLSDGSGGLIAGRWYKADADFAYASITATAVGMAPSAIASGASGAIRLAGRITGLGGLTAGATYFVSTSAGNLTSTAPSAGAFARILGVADSVTSLVLSANSRAQYLPAGTVSAPGVAVGDTDVGLYSSGTNALDFATNGTKALGIDSTQFLDSPTQPRCSAYHSTTQAFAASTPAVFNLNSEDIDVGSMHDTATNTSRITIPTGGDGLYLVVAQTNFTQDSGTDGEMQVFIRKNGTNTNFVNYRGVSAAGVKAGICVVGLLSLVATDYVEMYGDPGGRAFTTISNATRLSVVKLW